MIMAFPNHVQLLFVLYSYVIIFSNVALYDSQDSLICDNGISWLCTIVVLLILICDHIL